MSNAVKKAGFIGKKYQPMTVVTDFQIFSEQLDQ